MAKKTSSDFKRVQARNWNLMTYVSEDTILTALSEHSDIIRCYAYIYHDKFSDFELKDNPGKKHHFHIVVRLTRPLNLKTICNWFREFNSEGKRINTRAIPSLDFQSDYEYLIHKNDPDKYQFMWSDVKGFNEYQFKVHKNCDGDIAVDALNDLINGVPIYDICMRYGRDVIYHFSQLKYVFDLIYYGKEFEEVKNKTAIFNLERSAFGCESFHNPFSEADNIDNF